MSASENDSSSAVVDPTAGTAETASEKPSPKRKSALKQYVILGILGFISFTFGIAAVFIFATSGTKDGPIGDSIKQAFKASDIERTQTLAPQSTRLLAKVFTTYRTPIMVTFGVLAGLMALAAVVVAVLLHTGAEVPPEYENEVALLEANNVDDPGSFGYWDVFAGVLGVFCICALVAVIVFSCVSHADHSKLPSTEGAGGVGEGPLLASHVGTGEGTPASGIVDASEKTTVNPPTVTTGGLANPNPTVTTGGLANPNPTVTTGGLVNPETTVTTGALVNPETTVTTGGVFNPETTITTGGFVAPKATVTTGVNSDKTLEGTVPENTEETATNQLESARKYLSALQKKYDPNRKVQLSNCRVLEYFRRDGKRMIKSKDFIGDEDATLVDVRNTLINGKKLKKSEVIVPYEKATNKFTFKGMENMTEKTHSLFVWDLDSEENPDVVIGIVRGLLRKNPKSTIPEAFVSIDYAEKAVKMFKIPFGLSE